MALFRHAFVRSVLIASLLAALALIIVLPARRTVFLQDAERWGFDALVTHHQAQGAGEVVIVDFDETTQSALGTDQVPRTALAKVIQKISEGKPTVIGLDFLLTERRTPNGDTALQKAIQAAGNVVVSSQFETVQMPAASPLVDFCKPDPSSTYCEPGGALAVGLINLPVDEDGFIRRGYLLPPAGTSTLPLSVVLSSTKLQSALQPSSAGYFRLGAHDIPLDETGMNTQRVGAWHIPQNSTFSGANVLDPHFDPRVMKDKIVLVGQSTAAGNDLHFTPVFRERMADGTRKRLSGVEIHAAATLALLRGDAIRTISPSAALGIWLALGTLVAFTFVHSRVEIALLLTLFAAVFACGFAIYLFRWHLWLPFVAGELAVATTVPIGLGYRFVQERLLKSKVEAERKQIMAIFSRYVSEEVAMEIWRRREEIVIAGQEKIATVLFSDIRSFTKLTAGKDSAQVLRWLNEYFTAMARIVHEEKGFLNKFIGDGMMAVFGIPVHDEPAKDAIRAVRAAVRMLVEVKRLNVAHRSDPTCPQLRIGIGIHTGKLTAGNVGSEDRLEYSVIGDTVNLASRLESLCKEFNTSIVLSEATRELVKDQFPIETLGGTTVRGYEDSGEQTRVYSVAVDSLTATAHS